MRNGIIITILFILAVAHHPVFLFLLPLSILLFAVSLTAWYSGPFSRRFSKAFLIAVPICSVAIIAGFWYEAIHTYLLFK